MLNSSKCGFYHCFGAHSLARQKKKKHFNFDFMWTLTYIAYILCIVSALIVTNLFKLSKTNHLG